MNDVTIDIAFPIERQVEQWQYRHGMGDVPSFWPYGLDGLGRYARSLSARSLAEPQALARARSRAASLWHQHPLVQNLSLSHSRSSLARRHRSIALSWDENAARRMLAGCPRAEMYSGVIWVTDDAARGIDVTATRRVLRSMSGLWVISRAQLAPLRELIGENGPPIGFFRFGVDKAFFAYTPPPARPMVLSVGGDRDRDTAALFAALARVHACSPETEILVQTSSDLPAPAGVTKLDRVSHAQLAALYRRASVVAIATKPNLHASGMTVSLEAMASGRPVVITSTPGIGDYVEGGSRGRGPQTGLLTPVGDSAALAAAVVRLLDNPDEAHSLGRAGRQVVDTELNTEHMVRELASFIGLDH